MKDDRGREGWFDRYGPWNQRRTLEKGVKNQAGQAHDHRQIVGLLGERVGRLFDQGGEEEADEDGEHQVYVLVLPCMGEHLPGHEHRHGHIHEIVDGLNGKRSVVQCPVQYGPEKRRESRRDQVSHGARSRTGASRGFTVGPRSHDAKRWSFSAPPRHHGSTRGLPQ